MIPRPVPSQAWGFFVCLRLSGCVLFTQVTQMQIIRTLVLPNTAHPGFPQPPAGVTERMQLHCIRCVFQDNQRVETVYASAGVDDVDEILENAFGDLEPLPDDNDPLSDGYAS